MPYKVWAVNEILTAADMNSYVGNQTILSFAGTAARATAIGTPVEGMLSYVGSGVVEVYAGTATGWAEISGGGGGVTVGTAAPSTPAEGDLWLNSTEAKMYVYYDDGTSAQWVAAVGGTVPQQGKILQVVSTTKSDTFSASVASGGNSAVTGLSASITPSSTSSKILIHCVLGAAANGDGKNQVGLAIYDGSAFVDIAPTAGSRTSVTTGGQTSGTGAVNSVTMPSLMLLDSPATTSSITYSAYVINVRGATQTLYVNRTEVDSDAATSVRAVSTITLMEVAA